MPFKHASPTLNKTKNKLTLFFKQDLPAFSLVEIAISLVIIGLLISAVLKGQDLLSGARLKTLITQINQYTMATNTFLDRYGSLPGDYDKASKYISENLKDGNNNGMIEGLGLTPGDGAHGHEATSFWAHLAASDLIPDPGIQVNSTNLDIGKGIPDTKVGGGITISHTPMPELQGHWFIIGSKSGSTNQGGLLTPLEALSISKKMDSIDPSSGSVQMRNGAQGSENSLGSGGLCLKDKNTLNTNSKNPVCVLYVKLS